MAELDILRDLLVVFGAALVVVLVLSRLSVPTIGGFLVAGAVLGPSGLGWIRDAHQTARLAEVGVVLLLFTIGLEFSLQELRRLGRVLALGGVLQVGLTTAAVAALAVAAGYAAPKAVFFGFLAALSSTAIVLKGLAERGETDAPHGKLIVGVLLFQDLCVVPMMLVVPTLGGQAEGGALPRALLTAAAVVLVTLVLARQAVPRLLHQVAATRRRDLFILAVVLVCAGIAWLTALVGLSLALGAFLAGVVLADSEYGHQALADVLPLRDIFTSFFFVSVGMLLDLRVLVQHPAALLGLASGILLGKAMLASFAALVMRFPLRVALLAGFALAQVGEFSFVLASLGSAMGLLDGQEIRLFVAASVVTMFVTPFALRLGPRLAAGAARLSAIDRLLGVRDGAVPAPGLSGHVLALGYGVGGEMLVEVLERAGLPYAAIDMNAERVRQARRQGKAVYYGDVTSPEILDRAGIRTAVQVAVLLNDPDATLRAVRTARRLAPTIPLFARARYVADSPRLLEAGATEVVAQEFEASLEIIARVMRQTAAGAVSPPGEGRAPVETAETLPPAQALPQGLRVESVALREGAWVTGRSLAAARLRTRTGATVVALTRGEATAVHPSPEDVIHAGDVLCLVGDEQQVASARDLLIAGPRAG
jgi:CPA2 family monovalent cation:H+ antiporter-2